MADGLSPEQRSQLEMFNEVTAHARESSSAIQLLQACGWNVEQALQLHWAAGDEAPAAASSASAAGAGDLGTPLLAPDQGQQEVLLPGRGAPGVSGMIRRSGLVGRIVHSVWRFGASVFHLLCTFIFGSAGTWLNNGAASGALLSRALAAQYGSGVQFPNFFQGSFSQAVQEARRDAKLLVVYLHSDNGRYTQNFCTQVLSNDFIRMMLDENFLLWGGDIATMESHRVAQMIHARQYPCFCVLLPASIDEIRVIGALHGDVQVDATVALLTTCLEEMEMHRAEIIARREQHAEDRSLREDQDREFQEALALDKKREEEAKAEEAKQREAAQLAEEQRRKEEEEAAKLEAQRLESEARKKRKAEEMNAPGPECTARISIRLPAGQRLERKFSPDATLADVYTWADVLPYLPENKDRGVVVPDRFMLKTSFPARELTEMEKSVKDLQLSGAMVLLHEIED